MFPAIPCPPEPRVAGLLSLRLQQSQVPGVVHLQGPLAIPFPVEHDGPLARRRGGRFELADPPLHARSDRGKALVQDGVERTDFLLQASPASKRSDDLRRGVSAHCSTFLRSTAWRRSA